MGDWLNQSVTIRRKDILLVFLFYFMLEALFK